MVLPAAFLLCRHDRWLFKWQQICISLGHFSQKINDALGTALLVHGGGRAWWAACKDPATIRQLPTEAGSPITAHRSPKQCPNPGSFIGLLVLSLWRGAFSNQAALPPGKWRSLKAGLIFGRVGGGGLVRASCPSVLPLCHSLVSRSARLAWSLGPFVERPAPHLLLWTWEPGGLQGVAPDKWTDSKTPEGEKGQQVPRRRWEAPGNKGAMRRPHGLCLDPLPPGDKGLHHPQRQLSHHRADSVMISFKFLNLRGYIFKN